MANTDRADTMNEVSDRADGIGLVHRAGIVGFGSVAVIVSAMALASRDVTLDAGARAAVVALSLTYFFVAARQLRATATMPGAAYFVIQNALAIAVVWIGREGVALIPLPILTHAVLVLRRRWVLVMAGLHAVNWIIMEGLHHGWGHSPMATGEMIAGEIFVIAFAEVVAGERRARADLRDANRRLAEYATQAEELATTQERNRLARELHDSLGHYLTVIHVQIQAAESQMGVNVDRAKQALVKAARLTHEGLDDVRRSVAALRASPIDDRPLSGAVAELVEQLTQSGTQAHLSVVGVPRLLTPAVELALYRTAQEALTNVRKHARARKASVTLEYAVGQVRLSVHDDGNPAEPFVMGFGLIGVRERIRLVGGELEIRASDGFAVHVSVPA